MHDDVFVGILNGTDPARVVVLNNLFPKFIHASPSGQTNNMIPDDSHLANCTLSYLTMDSTSWWQLTEGDVSPSFIVLSDSVPAFATLSSYGIIGLYVAVVLTVGRFIRMIITDLTLRIMYEDLPNPDLILQLCLDILLAREFGEFETEETLFWRLITVFRSPQLLLELTHMKVD